MGVIGVACRRGVGALAIFMSDGCGGSPIASPTGSAPAAAKLVVIGGTERDANLHQVPTPTAGCQTVVAVPSWDDMRCP